MEARFAEPLLVVAEIRRSASFDQSGIRSRGPLRRIRRCYAGSSQSPHLRPAYRLSGWLRYGGLLSGWYGVGFTSVRLSLSHFFAWREFGVQRPI